LCPPGRFELLHHAHIVHASHFQQLDAHLTPGHTKFCEWATGASSCGDDARIGIYNEAWDLDKKDGKIDLEEMQKAEEKNPGVLIDHLQATMNEDWHDQASLRCIAGVALAKGGRKGLRANVSLSWNDIKNEACWNPPATASA